MPVKIQQEERVQLPPKWKKHRIRREYRSPELLNILNYIGLGLIGISLIFLLVDKNLFSPKLALLGCWMMFPATLYDAAYCVKALKIGLLDLWKMRSFVIILSVILWTPLELLK